MNATLWIEPGKCPTNPENVPINPENVPIFLNRKTLKQNTKTVRAKKLMLTVRRVCKARLRLRRTRKTEGWVRPTPDSQTFAGLRGAATRQVYRPGPYRLTPATPGLRAPARRDQCLKPRALTGRGSHFARICNLSLPPVTQGKPLEFPAVN
jgi:hypothetical protein